MAVAAIAVIIVIGGVIAATMSSSLSAALCRCR
jgi:hypothetical protein